MKKIKRLETYNKIFGSHIFDENLDKKCQTIRTRRLYFRQDSDIFNRTEEKTSRVLSVPRITQPSDIFNLNKTLDKHHREMSERDLKYVESDIFFLNTARDTHNSAKDFITIENNYDSIDEELINASPQAINNKNSLSNHIKNMPNLNLKKILSKETKEKDRSSSQYNPDKYYSQRTAFERQIDNLYKENYSASVRDFRSNGLKSSFGCNMRENYYNPEKSQEYRELLSQRHERVKNDTYTQSNRFDPNLTSRDNYQRGFCSMILQDMDEAMNKLKEQEKREKIRKEVKINKTRNSRNNVGNIERKSVGDVGRRINHNLNSICKLSANLNWKDNTEILIKKKDNFLNSQERKLNDQLDNVLHYAPHHLRVIRKNKLRKIPIEKVSSLNQYPRYIPNDSKHLPIHKMKSLYNTESDFSSKNFYENAFQKAKIRPKDVPVSTYVIQNCKKIDKVAVSKKLSQKGIHYLNMREETKDIFDCKNKTIQFQTRGGSDKTFDLSKKMKEVEDELKRESREREVKICELKPIRVNRKINRDIYKIDGKIIGTAIEDNRLGQVINSGRYNFNRDSQFSKGYTVINRGYKNSFLKK